MDRDLLLVGGEFLDGLLPKERQWLWKYFDTDIERQFVAYYETFGSYTHFTAHTGFYCTKRWLKKLKQRYNVLNAAHQQARTLGDFELTAEIEMGEYKWASGI